MSHRRSNHRLWEVTRTLSLPFIPSGLPTAARLSGTDIIFLYSILNSTTGRHHHARSAGRRRRTPGIGMRIPAAATSAQREIDRSPGGGGLRPRDAHNDDAGHRFWARKRPFRTRPAERVIHPVCPFRATGGSSNRDNSRGMSRECAANAVR
jgi:hypothetical protein